MKLNPDYKLSVDEKRNLLGLLAQEEPTIVTIHGEGENRQISFYAEGTRMEARIPYPVVEA